jgi:hypothetical protein
MQPVSARPPPQISDIENSPVSVGSRTGLCWCRQFPPGNGLALPETGLAFFGIKAPHAEEPLGRFLPPGYEAAAAAAKEEKRGGTVLVASGDRDTFQLASERTTILFPIRAGEIARIGPAEVRERYGVDPDQVPDFIALRGDPSDKIPGARGVGPKGATDLLRRYGTLEGVLASGLAQAEALQLYKEIATMDASAPLPSLASQKPTWGKAAALANEWGLNQLAERLGKLAETST